MTVGYVTCFRRILVALVDLVYGFGGLIGFGGWLWLVLLDWGGDVGGFTEFGRLMLVVLLDLVD